ncbi:molybdenum cofactor guanylyltransferase MobA [Arcobacter vandammei]|uniref:molybdenum cofactor guanylyltransferase MobA n=1 Tax=Arcobacter vandammei TaxID=2782243 RepID=UPI0018DF17F5|nr:molybdenum cofactor guanylyltransferase MobA [Arcobacter vandammei]
MSFEPFKIPCVILSGGKSQRMGEDKALLPFSSSNSLIEFQYTRLKPHFNDIYISSKIDKFSFLSDKSKIIFDENKDIYSPILALKTILDKFDEVFIITVDTPFIKLETIEKLINSSKSYDITIAKTPNKTHNLCGVFKKSCLENIKQMIENNIHKINYLIKNSNFKELEFLNEDEFLNINNQLEYEKAIKIII